MARAMLLALTFAVLTSGARYADYSVEKMPEYGGGIGDYEGPRDVPAAQSDEYHDHSQDAPASLDYKYEEDIIGKSESKMSTDLEDAEISQKPVKKLKRPKRPINDDANVETLDRYSPNEMIPKLKTNHRFLRNRPRLKVRSSEIEDDVTKNRLVKYSRNRNDDINDIETKDYDIREDKADSEDDNSHLADRTTTLRVVRRKPRDKYVKSKSVVDVEDPDDTIMSRFNKAGRRDPEYLDDNRRRKPMDRRLPQLRDPYSDGEEDNHPEQMMMNRMNPNRNIQYDDYYDMKRLQSIKNKLPSLLRRTSKARTILPTLTSSLTDLIWQNRRAELMVPRPSLKAIFETTTTTSTTTTSASTSISIIKTNKPPGRAVLSPLKQLSLAEQSRLSILKKAQRKESLGTGKKTTKPPVLLQVINKMQTVVMVEPPSSQEPWMRVKEVSFDTPERLEEVKRLMRRRLVANAKDIHDLTDNWDEMICDYIDLTLIPNAANYQCVSLVLTSVSYFNYILWFR